MKPTTIRKKRVSKKSKLSWRKHVNINDVEEFLEDKRLEERLGPPLETLSNDELFKIDTKPINDEPQLSSKARKKLKLMKPLRSFSVLESFTKVSDPIKKRNRVRSKEERKNAIIKKKEAENREKGILKPRELQSLRDREIYVKKKKEMPKRGDFNQNVWDSDDNLLEDEWFDISTVKHNLVGTGKSRKAIKTPKKPRSSILPSVEFPHPGMSYNPSYVDHQELIKIVADKEMKIIKEEEHLDRVTKCMFRKVTPQKRDSMWLQEMSQGLPTTREGNEPESDSEFKSVNPPVKNKKKTLQQRRKQREQMQQELMRRALKVAKKKVSDLHQLKALNKQIAKSESESLIIREKRKRMKLLKKNKTKRLSATKFEESELEFNMGPDISGNLRNLKTEGSLLTDRFKSLQKRNIIQPSVRQNRKKGKVKVYTKSGFKEDWMTTVARQKSI